MKLKLLYTFGLVLALCTSTVALSNECSVHEHAPAAVADSAPRTAPIRKEEETKTTPVKRPMSTYPIIRLLYI